MPVAYRKPPRALALPPNFRSEQPSDNDFTVLLQRDPGRMGIVPPAPPMPRVSAAPPQRADRLMPPQTAPRYADPEGSAPGTAVTVVPPAPKTAREQQRPRWQTLAMGAGVFLAFGCVSGIAVELALSERPHAGATAQSEIVEPSAARAPAPVATIVQPVTTAAPASAPAPAPAAAAGSPVFHASAAPAADTPAPKPAHHHRRRHHVAHPAAPAAAPHPPPAAALDPAPAVADPAIPGVDGTDSPAPAAPTPGQTPAPGQAAAPGQATPPPASSAPLDDMAAAVQTLNQAKAEESL